MCGGGAARVEETGELGRLSRKRPSPGSAAVRRRSGAESETFTESVLAGTECDVGAAAKAAMAGFLLLMILVFILGLRGLVEAREAREICGVFADLGRNREGDG